MREFERDAGQIDGIVKIASAMTKIQRMEKKVKSKKKSFMADSWADSDG